MLVLLACLALQDSTPPNDSMVFRRGQWAAQFSGGSGFGSLGVLKFRSPTRPLLLDLRVTGSHGEQSFDDSAGTHFAGLACWRAFLTR
jgi:hypothetical protein